MIRKLKIKKNIFFNWSVRHDAEKTSLLYDQLEKGCAEICQCDYCKEFANMRYKLFPPVFISMLMNLGINPEKEMEVYLEINTDKVGKCYKGWFHFVGYLENLKDITPEPAFVKIADNFEILFTHNIEMPHPVFMKYPLVQIEFNVILSEQNELLSKF